MAEWLGNVSQFQLQPRSSSSSSSNSNPYPNWSRKTVCCWRSSLELITIFKYICADSYTQPESEGRRTRMGPCVSCIQTSTWNIYYANIMPTTSYEHPDRCERKLTPLDKARDGEVVEPQEEEVQLLMPLQRCKQFPSFPGTNVCWPLNSLHFI